MPEIDTTKLRAIALALLIGAIGGYLFFIANMPLPWMLGSMLSVAVVAVAGAPVALSLGLRTVMIAILGTLLGSSFTPDIFDRLHHWAGGVALMLAFVTVMTAFSVALFVRWGGFDRVTAYFSGTPGGLGVMTIIGEQQGGDPRIIPLIHATRIFIVVFAIPMYLLLVKDLDVPSGAQLLTDTPIGTPFELLILTGCTILGLLIARLVPIPGAQILAPMLISAAAHITGLVEAAPPAVLVSAAQVVIGAGIGVRFTGLKLKETAWPLTFAVLSAVAMLLGAAVLAEIAAPFLGIGAAALLLALAPGGLAEMSMIALALGVDTAFIATMHIVRIILVVSLAPLAFRLIGWETKPPME